MHTLERSPGLWPRACQMIDKTSLFPLPYFPSSSLLPSSLPQLPTSSFQRSTGRWQWVPYFNPTSHHLRRCFDVFVVLKRAHACLGRGQGGPWAPGASPRGAIPAQTTMANPSYGPLGVASKSMLNLMSFVDLLGIDLRSFGRPC